MNSNFKFAVAVLLLAGTAVFLQARSRNEILPQREPLSSFTAILKGIDRKGEQRAQLLLANYKSSPFTRSRR